ncbi:hypothetical protein F8388_023901 [Cannabis sativa]|uniref:Uncharacterized protein n=1 Tax=Cannabis sativa TaxID=3483 RepID=A0A7J6EWK6_CANSA|nr:hypothetical protein F8388_023901 [Cannabis sativa]
MEVKPTVALRAMLVGGIAAFAKVGAAMKAAGSAKVGAAAVAMTAAATAAVSGSKQEQDASKQKPMYNWQLHVVLELMSYNKPVKIREITLFFCIEASFLGGTGGRDCPAYFSITLRKAEKTQRIEQIRFANPLTWTIITGPPFLIEAMVTKAYTKNNPHYMAKQELFNENHSKKKNTSGRTRK